MDRTYVGADVSPAHSGIVSVNPAGQVLDHYHLDLRRDFNVKGYFPHRAAMARGVFAAITRMAPDIVAIEDYEQKPNQQVAYQIAEVTGVVKWHLLYQTTVTLSLVNPRKLKSYVVRRKDVTKDDVIAYASEQGFDIPVKKRDKPGYDKEQRGDIADAFVLARMARDLDSFLSEQTPPLKGHIFLDRDYGLAFRDDLLLNYTRDS